MRVLIVRNNYNPKALEASLLLEAFFDKQHIDYQTYDRDDLWSNCSIIDQFPTSEEPAFNLAVVLGAMARSCAPPTRSARAASPSSA